MVLPSSVLSRGASGTRSANLVAIAGFSTDTILLSDPQFAAPGTRFEAAGEVRANDGLTAARAGLTPSSANIFRRSIFRLRFRFAICFSSVGTVTWFNRQAAPSVGAAVCKRLRPPFIDRSADGVRKIRNLPHWARFAPDDHDVHVFRLVIWGNQRVFWQFLPGSVRFHALTCNRTHEHVDQVVVPKFACGHFEVLRKPPAKIELGMETFVVLQVARYERVEYERRGREQSGQRPQLGEHVL